MFFAKICGHTCGGEGRGRVALCTLKWRRGGGNEGLGHGGDTCRGGRGGMGEGARPTTKARLRRQGVKRRVVACAATHLNKGKWGHRQVGSGPQCPGLI
jgi:hypothetical protein